MEHKSIKHDINAIQNPEKDTLTAVTVTIMCTAPFLFVICFLHLFGGRGRQMEDYVDVLFDPVLDQGPPVSNISLFLLLLNVNIM